MAEVLLFTSTILLVPVAVAGEVCQWRQDHPKPVPRTIVWPATFAELQAGRRAPHGGRCARCGRFAPFMDGLEPAVICEVHGPTVRVHRVRSTP